MSRTPADILLSLVALATLSACATPSTDAFSQVQPGMSREDVVELLGEPSSRFAVPADEVPFRGFAERFSYGDSIGSFATQLVFRDLPDDRVWSVLFDAEGRVLSTLEPDPAGAQMQRGFETRP